MTNCPDAELSLGDRANARPIQKILVSNAVDRAFKLLDVSALLDDQLCVVVDAPTDSWAHHVLDRVQKLIGEYAPDGIIAAQFENPLVFCRHPPARVSPSSLSSRDGDLASVLEALRTGRSVVAVFSPGSAELPTLRAHADHCLRVERPSTDDVALAIWEASGAFIDPAELSAVNALDLNDLAMLVRPRSSPERMVERLRSRADASLAQDDDIPTLFEAAGYGAARDWGLGALRVLERLRAGEPGVKMSDLPRGLLLAGPPGTGKSIYSRSLAKTLQLPIIQTSVSDWLASGDSHLGAVVKAAREAVDRATAYQPGLLFIDEVDSIVDRDLERGNSQSWWLNFVNSVLSSIDGAIKTPGLITVGACNNEARVDKALKRAGRLETIVHIELPTTRERLSILRFHSRGQIEDRDLLACAERTRGLSGADLSKAVRDARATAGDAGEQLSAGHLMAALAPTSACPIEDLRIVARHEAGHAIAGVLHDTGVLAVDIDRRHTQVAPPPPIMDRKKSEQILITLLAGRAADEVIGGAVNAGAGGGFASDLSKATALAAARHESLGLGSTLVCLGDFEAAYARVSIDPDLRKKVEADLKDSYRQAIALIRRHEQAVRALADELLTRRFMTRQEIDAFIAPMLHAVDRS